MHKSSLVAQYLLNKADETKQTLTPLQLMKLVYLCHGWMLGLYGRDLIEESVEAWKYGPVIRELYSVVKVFRSNPVEGPLIANLGDLENFAEEEKSIMDQVFKIYGNYTGIQLSMLTHAPGTPWSITWEANDPSGDTISNDLIKDHFSELAA